ncbi:AtpZ/AtpI family protein [Tepidamorphus sp. 3E244]|uniref:AtpZ/AtpI family protein n=1 Tax=Tepidamorphus sp. 3E244 TaxID=3385498 RepID=UPI0038FCE7E6
MPEQTNERDSAGRTGGDDRLDRLGEALSKAKGKSSPEPKGRGSSASGFGQALRMSSEFVAGILVGAGLGWLIDRVFDTAPWGLIVFLMLGFGAGILNILRAAKLVDDPASRLNEPPEKGE